MKKYFLSIVALAGMLFATSCQESLVEPQVGGTTTFTVQLPDQMGTKAYGDEASTKATINKLYVEVYSEQGDDQLPVFVGDFDVNEAQATVRLNLVATQKYDIIFWAQNDNAYSWTDLRSIVMNTDHHNSETGAAFYAVLNDFVPSTSGQQEVILRRPFAQLNLGTTTTVSTGEVQVLESTIEILGVAKTFDRVSNEVSGQGGVSDVNAWTYTSTQNKVATGTISVNNDDYTYVSMDYFAVPGNRAVVDVKATIKVLDLTTNAESVIVREIKQVPVQMNYRTNIVGNLISSTTDFVVTIEEGFVDENGNQNPDNDYFVVDNVSAAKDAFDNGETHVAINNIRNTQPLQLPDNGKELYLQLPDSDGQITIKRDAGNFNISVPDTNPSNTGLTIIIDAPNSTVGFTGQAFEINSTTASNTLNLSGANVGTIIVMQGNVVIENKSQVEDLYNQSGEEVVVYVDKTSTVEEDIDSNFKKIEEPEKINTLEALQNALTYSTSDVIVVPNGIVNPSGSEFTTLSLNGKTVTAVDNATGNYGLITNYANLTIVGPGTISLSATNNRGWNAYSSVISNNPGGNLVVEGGVVIEHLGGTDMAYGIDNLTNGKGTSAIATINYATVKSTYRAVRQFLNGVEANNSLTVNSYAVIEGANKSIWMQDPSKNANKGTLVVEEGATLKGDVYLYVCAGSTEWPVSVSIAASTVKGEVLTGNVPAGYEVVCENGVWFVRKYTTVSKADELVAALEANENVIFANDITIDPANKSNGYGKTGINVKSGQAIDGNGSTLDIKGAGGTWDSGIGTTGGLIKNITVTGSFRGIFMPGATGDVYIDNVIFEKVTYTFNSDAGNKNYGVYISNSTLNGWTSHSDVHKEVVYTNCSFGEGNGNAFCRPYGPTSFVECDFEEGFKVDARGRITFENCTIGGVALTAENLATLVIGGIANATVK